MSALQLDLIRALFYAGQSTSAELSAKLSKSIPIINKGLSELIASGYVEDRGLAPSNGGRRPLVFSLVKDKMYLMVVAMDHLSTRMSIVDLNNQVVSPLKTFEIDLIYGANTVEVLTENIENYIVDSKISRAQIAGIGIAMPGFVDSTKGINFSYLHSAEKSLASHLFTKVGVPVFIDNDSHLVALAEYKFGNISNGTEVMVINFARGIGLGMIVNGMPYRGYNGLAGEFSHIAITDEEILCTCGKQGCLEAVASLLSVSEKALLGIKNGRVSSLKNLIVNASKAEVGNAILREAIKGDQYAIELLSESAYKIGRAVSILIHIMNPQTIILSGNSPEVTKLMLAPIQQALNKYCIPALFLGTEIKISELGNRADLIGASILIMDNLDRILS